MGSVDKHVRTRSFGGSRQDGSEKTLRVQACDVLGNAPAHRLFELVEVMPKHDLTAPARSFTDYEVVVQRDRLPGKWS